MKRMMMLAGALSFVLCSAICQAQEAKDVTSQSGTAVIEETTKAPSAGERTHIDLDDEQDGPSRVGTMSPGQSYDEETGMPDMTERDSDMELD